MKFVYHSREGRFWSGLCLLASGILLFFASGAVLAILMRIIGAAIITVAAVRCVRLMRLYERGSYLTVALFNTVLLFLFGVVMLILPGGALNLVFFAAGGYLVLNSTARVLRMAREPKRTDSPSWWASVVFTAAAFLLGLLLLLSPREATRAAEIIAAVSLTVKGCELLSSAMSVEKSEKKKPEEIEAEFVDKTDEEF